MSAVIGIANKFGVAVAADSAVSVVGHQGMKIFNHANKIYRISGLNPIGLMVYNQGEFMGITWEIIAKDYRKLEGHKTFNTLIEYQQDFLKFLHTKKFYCDTRKQTQVLDFMIRDLLESNLRQVLKNSESLIQSQHPDIGTIIGNALLTQLNRLNESLKRSEPTQEFVDLGEEELNALKPSKRNLDVIVHQIIKQPGVRVDTETVINLLDSILFNYIKSKEFFNFFSGLVFVGYGDSEIFPSIVTLKISNALNERLRFESDKGKSINITHDMLSAIVPFAQTDVIDTVLQGIEPGMNDLYMRQFSSFLKKHNENIAEMVEHSGQIDLGRKLRNINVGQLQETLQRLLNQQRTLRYINPMMNALSTLSKEDLAEMAESLIYLTYLKRRFTFAPESVGGPVDVAIITKGDGFIWIKRKHYFDTALNPHFLKNY